MAEADHPYKVPALERGMQLLMLFDRNRREIGAPEIGQLLGIPRTSVFRLLQTLENLELVTRATRTMGGAYRLGPAVLRLGFEYIASLDITELGRPVVEALCAATDLPTQLVIRDGREVVVILRLTGNSAFQSNVSVGTRMPAHATALGRVMLADVTESELRKLYPERALERFSAQTPASVAELRRIVAEDRLRGYALSDSFYERGISAVAAPVRDGTDRIVAAISVTTQREAIPGEERDVLARKVVAAADELSRRLNYRGNRAAA